MELLHPLVFNHTKRGASLHLSDSRVDLVSINALNQKVFELQLKKVESYAALRSERSAEILSQVVPQTAHWSAIAGMSPDHHRFTWELLGVGLRFAMMMVMRFKHHFGVERPGRRSAVIQPMILTPGYTAYPCGHATEASFVAELIPLLSRDPTYPKGFRRADGIAQQLNRLAFRIAENRVVAGLHYPVDTIAGQALGVMLARYVVWLAGEEHLLAPKELTVGAAAFPEPKSLTGDEEPEFDCFLDQARHVGVAATSLRKCNLDAPVLGALWALAQREWT